MLRRWWTPAVVLIALLSATCAEPPHKEMDQAQGAIDAAKAAGADRYATTEYAAAVDALKRSQDAAAQGDYRLALNHALDSRERAQNAAREAADNKAQLRGDAAGTMAEVPTLMAQATARLDTALKARVPRRVLSRPTKELATLNNDVQKAREAMQAGDYLAARQLLNDVKARIQKANMEIEAALKAHAPRRRR